MRKNSIEGRKSIRFKSSEFEEKNPPVVLTKALAARSQCPLVRVHLRAEWQAEAEEEGGERLW